MIFSSKNAFAEIIHQPKISAEEKLLSLVHQTWENFNHFLDSNLRMLIVFMKDMSQMRDRQKEQVQTLLQNIKGARSRSGSEDNSDEGPNIVKSNGMIFHDFNYPEYVNSLFAEEEVIKKDFVLMATEPEAQKSVKVVENPVTEKTLTPYQIDMRKMKTVVKKAESHAKENVSGAAEFRAQFTDFLKNVNQSYALLKGSIIEDKTKKDEKADKTTVADETGQSSINLFQKMKVKKKYMITEIKPKAKPEPRVVSAVLNDAQKPLISKRRLSAVRHNKKYTESSLRYEDSDSGMKVKILLLGQNHEQLWQKYESRPPAVSRTNGQPESDSREQSEVQGTAAESH